MPPAIIGGVIAGVGAIGAAALGSSATKKATATATAAATDASVRNEALQRDIYNQNKGVLAPFVNGGYGASSAINALLGIPTTGGQAPGTQTNALAGYGDPMQSLGADQVMTQAPTPNALSPYQTAFDNYQKSTGYGFRFGEGMKGLNASFAARGLGNSGAAAKSALAYGQNIASDEFGKYLGYLGNQQQVGLSAGNALAGVATNFANSMTANNNSLADAYGNAAGINSSAQARLYGTAATGIGNVGGALSSYNTSYTGGGWGADPYRTPGINGQSQQLIAANRGIF